MKEFATAWGRGLTCGAHDRTILGLIRLMFSLIVIASAKDCNG